MQWKQLLVLLLGCVSGPLESHTSLFLAFLATLTAQLQLGFGIGGAAGCGGGSSMAGAGRSAEGGGAEAESGGDVGAALLGGGLVEELLPDSFLKQAFRGFFEMLEESGAEVPAALLAQVGAWWLLFVRKGGCSGDGGGKGWPSGTLVVRVEQQICACLHHLCVSTSNITSMLPATPCCSRPHTQCAQARPLETVLAAGLGWDFRLTDLLGGGGCGNNSDSEGSDDEFRPVVVELTEQQLAELEAAAGGGV